MARPHAASIVEDALNRRVAGSLREWGWGTRIVPHAGYGTSGFVRVLGRVLMSRQRGSGGGEESDDLVTARLRTVEEVQRGWRAFVTAPAVDVPVSVVVNDRTIATTTDRAGLVDVTVRGHGFGPGWHSVTLTSPGAGPVEAPVLVAGTTQRFGIVSDIDDTVLSTSLPRPMVAAWNTFVRAEVTRRAVPGMATLYRELVAAHPGAPVVYLSTGAWNTAPTIERFLRRNGFPVGPLLLTDWGPTSTGWFRSGSAHKRGTLHRLAREMPHVQWLLVGDDGQHDPRIYAEFAAARPDSVTAIALRELSVSEQVLTNGIPVASDELAGPGTAGLTVPVLRASDGYELARLLRPALTAPAAAH
jgi:phosphatidate phosphatase APP1